MTKTDNRMTARERTFVRIAIWTAIGLAAIWFLVTWMGNVRDAIKTEDQRRAEQIEEIRREADLFQRDLACRYDPASIECLRVRP